MLQGGLPVTSGEENATYQRDGKTSFTNGCPRITGVQNNETFVTEALTNIRRHCKIKQKYSAEQSLLSVYVAHAAPCSL